MQYIKGYAQEMADDVVRQHIDLYVNDYSITMGKDGEAALAELLRRADQADTAQH
jgi:1,4-dihydroxy-6-naphthoate synthase